jgi:hypothetical protein
MRQITDGGRDNPFCMSDVYPRPRQEDFPDLKSWRRANREWQEIMMDTMPSHRYDRRVAERWREP